MKRGGSLHIIKLGPDSATGQGQYSVTYAPYDRRGGALPPYVVRGDSELRRFLQEIDVNEPAEDRAFAELNSSGRTSLHNVVLSDEQLKRYGLGEMGIIQSVISYLST